MACKCGSTRILNISGKCSDMCFASFGEFEHEGYTPEIPFLGGGDYLELGVCVDCGLVQDFKPLTDRQIENVFNGNDLDEIDDDEE